MDKKIHKSMKINNFMFYLVHEYVIHLVQTSKSFSELTTLIEGKKGNLNISGTRLIIKNKKWPQVATGLSALNDWLFVIRTTYQNGRFPKISRAEI